MWTRPLRLILRPSHPLHFYPFHSIQVLKPRYSSSAVVPRIAMPSAHKFSDDRIFVDKLFLKCTCGPNAFGLAKPQSVLLSVELGTTIARAAASDRVDLSVDYSALSKQLIALEKRNFGSAVELIDHVTELGLQKHGVGKASVSVSLEKGVLTAKNVKWERIAPSNNGLNEWKLGVEGIQVPLIIGIEENIHERTQKQLVIIDLTWSIPNGSSDVLSSFDVRNAIDSIINKVSKTSYQSIESLATYIAKHALNTLPHAITVSVRKPSAVPFAAAAGVTITRHYGPPERQDEQEVYIALGSNLGDRLRTMEKALEKLESFGIHILDVSGLYESEPMYVQQQPQFLNAVCKARTTLPPHDLLTLLKQIETDLERLPSIRNGPRTLDLDILLYGDHILDHENLVIPHASILERGFVLQPLVDIAPDLIHPTTFSSIRSHLEVLPPPAQHNYLPLHSTHLDFDISHHRKPTLIMAILNLTPDSFSDGGKHSLDSTSIVETVREMVDKGAHIIDIGGQSTRPNAEEISPQDEIDRVIPAIQVIRQSGIKIPISVDTYRAAVAEAAIQAGADIINDVSAGTLDPEMFSVIAKLNVPVILMHMRGNPTTMNSLAKYDGDLIEIIGRELSVRVKEAIRAGIRRWNIILDPGLGFAKNKQHNIEILRRMEELRTQQGLSGMPWTLGPSRKRFIVGITGEDVPSERTWGTAGAIAACVQGGADIVRVHDIAEMSKVVKMSDAIWRSVNAS